MDRNKIPPPVFRFGGQPHWPVNPELEKLAQETARAFVEAAMKPPAKLSSQHGKT